MTWPLETPGTGRGRISCFPSAVPAAGQAAPEPVRKVTLRLPEEDPAGCAGVAIDFEFEVC